MEYAEKASGGGWRSVEVPTSGVASLEPVLAAGADGVYLAWSEVGDGSDGGPPGARLMVSRRPIR